MTLKFPIIDPTDRADERIMYWDAAAGVHKYKDEATGVAAAFSGFLLTKSAAQTGLAASTNHAVTFDGEAFDTDTYHDNATNPSRVTVPFDGKYLVGAIGEWAAIADQKQVICRFYVDGAAGDGYFRRISSGTGFNSLQITQLLDLTAGQYVEFRMFQADTTTRDIVAGAIFWGYKVG